ncbi:T5orf172 domain-containing protein [Pyrenochaeta sp. MPI-SDFR-AT-0127]|nr:T5orf172 domain-containing protein [Pyrenochaeta sp. MPI-SDFR-AT-0127]
MPFNPGVGFFIKFHDLDPVAQDKCIYFTQQGRRCRWYCRDNNRAIELHQRIADSKTENISVDTIIEYILYNCCREGNAKHRDRIINIGLLIPLAERWLNEIQQQRRLDEAKRQIPEPSTPATSTSIPWISSTTASTYAGSVTWTPSRAATLETPMTSPSYHRIDKHSPFSNSSPDLKPDTSPTPAPRTSLIDRIASQSGSQASQAHYDLRSRQVNLSAVSLSPLATLYSKASLSEFQPHVEEPSYTDAVAWKIGEPLVKRDFERGSVYIFNRASSPGHVKIGWTAASVETRLQGWSTCGYIPNKLFSVDNVPHAQRVETLTHHELIKEWRRERMCKAKHCQVSHQEWFEVSEQKAIEVLSNWADFFKKATPYDLDGSLNAKWKGVVNMLDANGEVTTSLKLLEHHTKSLKRQTKVKDEPIDIGLGSKEEEQDSAVAGARQKKSTVSPRQVLFADTNMLNDQKFVFSGNKLPLQVPPATIFQPRVETLPTIYPNVALNASSSVSSLSGPPQHDAFVFTANPSFDMEPSSKGKLVLGKEPEDQLQLPAHAKVQSGSGLQSAAAKPSKSELPRNIEAPLMSPIVFRGSLSSKDKSLPMSESPCANNVPPPKGPVFGKETPITGEPLARTQPLFEDKSTLEDVFVFNSSKLTEIRQPSSMAALSTELQQLKIQPTSDTKLRSKSEPTFQSRSSPTPIFGPIAASNFRFGFEAKVSTAEQLPKVEPSPSQTIFTPRAEVEKQSSIKEPLLGESSSLEATLVEGPLLNQTVSPSASNPEPKLDEDNKSITSEKDITEDLVNLSLEERELGSKSPTAQRRETENTDEPESEFEKQSVQGEERKPTPQNGETITIINQETGFSVIEWEEEETLIERQEPLTSKMAKLEIIDDQFDVVCAEVTTKAEKGLDGVKIVESEITSDLEVVLVS